MYLSFKFAYSTKYSTFCGSIWGKRQGYSLSAIRLNFPLSPMYVYGLLSYRHAYSHHSQNEVAVMLAGAGGPDFASIIMDFVSMNLCATKGASGKIEHVV